MSRPWKSELSVQLGRGATAVQRLAPWSRRVLDEVRCEGAPAQALPAALSALRERSAEPLPAQARLCVPDELAYFSLLAGGNGWHGTRQAAVTHFAATLGRQDLVVQAVALPGAAAWLAAAIEPGDLQAWQRALAEAGVRLARVELQLLDDLRHLARQVPDEAIVALLREEGSTLLRIERGVPVELSWERCDPRALRLVEQRLVAFQGAIVSSQPPAVWMLCRSTEQREHWERMTQAHGWTLLMRDASPAPAAAAEAGA
ncbi:hypothetical protein [Piscinibacter sp.]|uniref:hypothetical protein n=1 Tax=Piscinibacter sp. TaxID=1903157 RepID=UPI001B7056DC|nr:hypothetical protein [Piscinibacter sp.]MBP5990885.1 hypothetical protein [Piscinibacter sp.]MBP6028477.1 hypothetical protein [Piscinibacter sp.]